MKQRRYRGAGRIAQLSAGENTQQRGPINTILPDAFPIQQLSEILNENKYEPK